MTELPTKVEDLAGRVTEEDGFLTYLDPSEGDEREAIEYFLDRSGKTADRYPALHQALANGESGVPAAPLDECRLVDAGQTEDGTATARTWVCSTGYAFISGAHTMLVDRDGGVLASGSATQVGGGLVRNATGDGAAAATPRMTGISFFHAQSSPGEPARFGLAAAPVAPLADGPTYTITEPVEVTHKHKAGYVVIGMCRQTDWPNTDCDYVYPEQVNVEPDRLVVPFSGSVEFPMDVNLPAQNIQTELWCDKRKLSMLPYPGGLEGHFGQVNSNTIKWSFPYDDKSIRETASLRYEPLPVADENLSAFYFTFQVMGAEGALQTATVCSATWPDKPSTACGSVLDIEYWWHCVEAGAQVTLGDGSKKPLSEINNRCEVLMPVGGKALVEATTLDIHDVVSEDVVMELKTAGGRSLVLSALHPLFVNGAPVMARDLKAGEEIAVEGGTDQVASCAPLPSYTGQLGNLQLAGPGVQGFYANGIAVGDFTALRDSREKTAHDPEYMLPRLPESHHQDFLSALADATPPR